MKNNLVSTTTELSDNQKITNIISSANHKQGVNPTHFLEFLTVAVKNEPWKEFGISFVQWVTNTPDKGGINYELDVFIKLIFFRHDKEREDNELHEKLQEMRKNVGYYLKKPSIASRIYNENRLKKTDPVLYKKYLNGQIRLGNALKKIGLINKTHSYRLYVDSAVNSLLKNFNQDDLDEIARKISS